MRQRFHHVLCKWHAAHTVIILCFINNRVSVEATLGSLGYRHYYGPKIITINPFRKDNDYAGLNVSGSLLNLGINYYFVKKQK